MARKRTEARPRPCYFMGRAAPIARFSDGTWLEAEEMAYPNGGYTRRALATCEDGTRRVVRCSIADTFFSIPARYKSADGKRVKGYLSNNEDNSGIRFTAYERQG